MWYVECLKNCYDAVDRIFYDATLFQKAHLRSGGQGLKGRAVQIPAGGGATGRGVFVRSKEPLNNSSLNMHREHIFCGKPQKIGAKSRK
jgi:hypothetical protein